MKLNTSTPAATRRAINKIMNMLLAGEIDTKTANTLIYGCNAAISAYKVIDMESRIREIEELLNG